jgi:hypothetical protein
MLHWQLREQGLLVCSSASVGLAVDDDYLDRQGAVNAQAWNERLCKRVLSVIAAV